MARILYGTCSRPRLKQQQHQNRYFARKSCRKRAVVTALELEVQLEIDEREGPRFVGEGPCLFL